MSEPEQKALNGKTNKIIIAIVIVAVIVLSGYFLFRGASQPTPTIVKPSEEILCTQEWNPICGVNGKTYSNECMAKVASITIKYQGECQSSGESSGQATSQSAVSQAPTVKKKVVTYTDAGYSPITLRVKKGETVIFKNQSSRSMWTASAVHPTHRAYPTTGGCLGSSFDACTGVQPGDSWSFKFAIVGTWKYHNHLNPSITGTVIVE